MPRKSPNQPPSAPPKAPDARKTFFDPSSFIAVRAEDIDAVANLKANLIAVYQPVNSEELFALERLAVARHSLLRTYRIEAGLITVGLEEALEIPGNPRILKNPELTNGLKVTPGQNHNYWTAAGFCQLNRKSDWQMFLRYQAQAERLYRRAVEDFERIRALRGALPEQRIVESEPAPEAAPQPILADPPGLPLPTTRESAAENPAAVVPHRSPRRRRRPTRTNCVPLRSRAVPISRQSAKIGGPNAP